MFHHKDTLQSTINRLNEFVSRSTISKSDYDLVILNHSLKGLFDQNSDEWRKQYYRNTLQELFLKELVEVHQWQDQFVVLKGMSFADYQLYQNLGQRLTSDIDLWVEDLADFSQKIESLGFEIVANHKWKGNDYKIILSKFISGIEIVVELHSRVFYHVKNDQFKTKYSSLGFKVFELEDLLLHLVGHLAFQHTFLKLHWLLDIELFLNRYSDVIDWNRFRILLVDYQLESSWKFTCLFLDMVFHDKKPQPWIYKFLVAPQFILFPESNKVRYYLLKHLLKDQFQTSFRYNFWWILQQGWKK